MVGVVFQQRVSSEEPVRGVISEMVNRPVITSHQAGLSAVHGLPSTQTGKASERGCDNCFLAGFNSIRSDCSTSCISKELT